MDQNVVVREITADDIPELVEQRKHMYEDMGQADPEALSRMVSTTQEFLAQAIPEGSFHGWFASIDGKIVAGGAVLIVPWMSHAYDGECRRATILNMYTYPEFRRKGIARQIMRMTIEWCRKQGLAIVYLHASVHGRALYESLGFEPTNEMRLKLR